VGIWKRLLLVLLVAFVVVVIGSALFGVTGGTGFAMPVVKAPASSGYPSSMTPDEIGQTNFGEALTDSVLTLGATAALRDVYGTSAISSSSTITVYLTKLDPGVEAKFRRLFVGSLAKVVFAKTPTPVTGAYLNALGMRIAKDFRTLQVKGIDVVSEGPEYHADGLVSIGVINLTPAAATTLTNEFGPYIDVYNVPPGQAAGSAVAVATPTRATQRTPG
jgi:hypothetical protein